jgi:hypothetical protein
MLCGYSYRAILVTCNASRIRHTLGMFSYVMFVVQHPYGADTICTDTVASWSSELANNPLGT